MRAPVIAAFCAAVLAVGALGSNLRHSTLPLPSARGQNPSSKREAECPPGALPDEGVCVPVPRAVTSPGAQIRGTLRADRIPRRADRPPEYERFRLPVAALAGARVSAWPGGDGGPASGALRLPVAPHTAVTAVRLEGQVGATSVLFEGRLVGTTVVTHHAIANGAEHVEILLVVGDLDEARPLPVRAEVAEGDRIGTAGHAPIALEARVVRSGVDAWSLSPEQLFDDALTVSEDARNVLSRR